MNQELLRAHQEKMTNLVGDFLTSHNWSISKVIENKEDSISIWANEYFEPIKLKILL